MKVGNNIKIIYFFIFCFLFNSLNANEKISTAPLINLDQIKPSFEEIEENNDNNISDKKIKNKTRKKISHQPRMLY